MTSARTSTPGAGRVIAATAVAIAAASVIAGAFFTLWLRGQSFGGPVTATRADQVIPPAITLVTAGALGGGGITLLLRTRWRVAVLCTLGAAILAAIGVAIAL